MRDKKFSGQCHEQGTTLLEIVISLTLLVIIMAGGWYGWQAWLDEYYIYASGEQIKLILNHAQMLRRLYTQPLIICHTKDHHHCSQSLHNQYLLQVHLHDEDKILRVFPALDNNTTVVWHFFKQAYANEPLYFASDDRQPLNGSIVFCRHHQAKRALIINKQGNFRWADQHQWKREVTSLYFHLKQLESRC